MFVYEQTFTVSTIYKTTLTKIIKTDIKHVRLEWYGLEERIL
jgi:hypothetical protein